MRYCRCRRGGDRARPLLVLVVIAAAVPWPARSEIVPGDRRVEWLPGVPGGIPTVPVSINVTDPPFGAVGDGVADDGDAFDAAVAAAPEHTAIFVPPGTYRLTHKITIDRPVVIRGAGPAQTTIVAEHQRAAFGIQGDGPEPATSLAAATAPGTITLVVDDAFGLAVGGYLLVERASDEVSQVARIAALDGNAVTLERPLHAPYQSGDQVHTIGVVEWAGVEDLKILTDWPLDGYSNSWKVQFGSAARSWARNVETDRYVGIHVMMSDCYQCELRDSYLHHSLEEALAKDFFVSYGVDVRNGSSDCLVENNVFDNFRHAMVIQYDNAGANVFGYNLSWSVYTHNSGTGQTERALIGDIEFHHQAIHYTLVEGNSAEMARLDSGGAYQHTLNTFMRNRITQAGITTGDSNNFVGNELPPAKYEVDSTGWYPKNNVRAGDDNVIHGNYVAYGDEGLTWDPAIPDHDIPASYYYSAKPSWFGDLVWPPFGGDMMPGNRRRSPAEVRFWSIQFPEQAPSGLSATQTAVGPDPAVQLSWTSNSVNPVDFVIVRSTGGLAFERIDSTFDLSYLDTEVEIGGQYWYYVRARNHLGGEHGDDLGGESEPSQTVSVLLGLTPIFADGLESGATDAWSLTVP